MLTTKKFYWFLTSSLILLVFVSCNQQEHKAEKKDTTGIISSSNQSNNSDKEIKSRNEDMSKFNLTYSLKEDGLYVYADGPAIKVSNNGSCFYYKQKNYKYIKLDSKTDKIAEDKFDTYGECFIERKCTTDLGKPSLFELGYERHKEREIKPEDNRFGIPKLVESRWTEIISKVKEQKRIKYISSDQFTVISSEEFKENGIVIIGDNISRVVIKKPVQLQFSYNPYNIVVEYSITQINCDGTTNYLKYEPELIANFKRIDLKENIFEFIQENPLPGNAAYLTDSQLHELSGRTVQLIPRTDDRTIRPGSINKYEPGYYFVEYYSGDRLINFHCIRLNGKGQTPDLWDALKYNAPNAAPTNVSTVPVKSKNIKSTNKTVALVVNEFNNRNDAENFIKSKDSYPFIVLPESENNQYLVGRYFNNLKSANKELKRLSKSKSFKKNNLRIIEKK